MAQGVFNEFRTGLRFGRAVGGTRMLTLGFLDALRAEHRIRLDGPELEPTLQSEINRLWDQVTTENFRELSDYDGFKRGFRQLFGFEVDGVDYGEPVEIDAEV